MLYGITAYNFKFLQKFMIKQITILKFGLTTHPVSLRSTPLPTSLQGGAGGGSVVNYFIAALGCITLLQPKTLLF